MRRSALLAVLAGAAVVLVGVLVWWWPFLTGERTFVASIPQPAPLFSRPLIPLEAGAAVCFDPAIIDTRSERAAFVVNSGARPGEPLRLTMTGPSYRFAAAVPGGYATDSAIVVPVTRPSRDVALRVCIENAGRHSVSLWGVDDRTRTPMTVTAGGRKVAANVQFAFYEARPSSIASHLSVAFRRMATFRPGFLGPWLFWPLALICFVGHPGGGAVGAVALDRRRARRRAPAPSRRPICWSRP